MAKLTLRPAGVRERRTDSREQESLLNENKSFRRDRQEEEEEEEEESRVNFVSQRASRRDGIR